MALVHPEARIVDAATGAVLAGEALHSRIEKSRAAHDGAPPGVIFALMPTTVDAVLGYLGALAAGRCVALLDPALPNLEDLVGRFRPAWVTGIAARPMPDAPSAGPVTAPAAPDGYWSDGAIWRRWAPAPEQSHAELTLLLATSGSTGNPRLVRLSGKAVQASADAIIAALGLDGDEFAVTALPLYYTLGLSVLNSHLRVGATVVVTDGQVFQRPFWSTVDTHRVTSLTIVPYQFEMLRRIGFDPSRHRSLRTLATSGGRLRPEVALEFHARMAGRLFLMYGATEATARMTVLPPERLPDKPDSVGLPVPGGQVSIMEGNGEILFGGASVMMGYAETATDLTRGGDLGGVLATGDVGHLDAEGFLYLDGRLKRLGKVFGVRLNLDDIEHLLADHGPVAALADDDHVLILAPTATPAGCERIRQDLAARLRLHRSGFVVRSVAELPRRPNGKLDYGLLAKEHL